MRYEDLLKSNTPAKSWAECYPLGNGNIGVMDYGDVSSNTISINDDRLWSGTNASKNNPDKGGSLEAIREAITEENFDTAETLIQQNILGGWSESFLPLGDLLVTSNIKNVQGYNRSLNMARGIQTVSYNSPVGEFLTESFVSAPAGCYVAVTTCPTPTDFTFTMSSKLQSSLGLYTQDESVVLSLSGIAPDINLPEYHKCENPTQYNTGASVKTWLSKCIIVSDGKISIEGNIVTIKDCTSYQVVMTTEVQTLKARDLVAAADKKLNAVISKPYSKVVERHADDYSQLYNRCFLEIGGDEVNAMTADLLKHNRKYKNNKLITILFNYGRYLTISSSRRDTYASNLQGIWNDTLCPPWSSNYTLNINTQMNYWPTLIVGLTECHLPMIDLIKKIYNYN